MKKIKPIRKNNNELSPLKWGAIWILCSIIAIIVIHYIVVSLFWIGNSYMGLPTFLDEEKMLTYIVSVLAMTATVTVSAISLYQTWKTNELKMAPTIMISDGGNLFYELSPRLLDGVERLYHEGASIREPRETLKLLFQVIDKSIESLSVENFFVCSFESREKIYELPISNVPGQYSTNKFLVSNFRICIFYDICCIPQGKTYIGSFFTTCKMLSGERYKKKWEIQFTRTEQKEIIIHSIEGEYWKRVKE